MFIISCFLTFWHWFLTIWETWGVLAGCVGVLEKRREDVLIRHNHIPLCPWASIKSALAASAGLSGPAGLSRNELNGAEPQSDQKILRCCRLSLCWVLRIRLFTNPSHLSQLLHSFIYIIRSETSQISLFLFCCFLHSISLRFWIGSRQPANMMKDCLQFLIEPAKKLKFRLKVQCVICSFIHSFTASKGLSVIQWNS